MTAPEPDQRAALLELYDSALPDVYGYLVARCGSAAVAEDLTSETFLAACDAIERGTVPDLTIAWLIGVARQVAVTAELTRGAIAEHGWCTLGMYSDNPIARDLYTDLGYTIAAEWTSGALA